MVMTVKSTTLDKSTIDFIENLGLFMQEVGLPRSVGRVLGLLLISQPRYRSSMEIQGDLQLSGGSVSAATSLLQRMGIVKRVTVNGSRQLYYELDPECWQKIIETRLQQIRVGIQIADQGLSISRNNPSLLGMRQLYVEFEYMLQNIKLRPPTKTIA